mmetsp:Transcript_80581/g.193273  ORF Transcript_80581/g.193273 Transcript_80581/m.193273 type:complete len:354 (+) Transcript_80581:900-1961(+)
MEMVSLAMYFSFCFWVFSFASSSMCFSTAAVSFFGFFTSSASACCAAARFWGRPEGAGASAASSGSGKAASGFAALPRFFSLGFSLGAGASSSTSAAGKASAHIDCASATFIRMVSVMLPRYSSLSASVFKLRRASKCTSTAVVFVFFLLLSSGAGSSAARFEGSSAWASCLGFLPGFFLGSELSGSAFFWELAFWDFGASSSAASAASAACTGKVAEVFGEALSFFSDEPAKAAFCCEGDAAFAATAAVSVFPGDAVLASSSTSSSSASSSPSAAGYCSRPAGGGRCAARSARCRARRSSGASAPCDAETGAAGVSPLSAGSPARLRRRSARLRAPRIGELRRAAAAATVEA